MKTICVDAGFLIALYDEKDKHLHSQASDFYDKYFESTQNKLLIPWPILYETVSSRMVKNPKRMLKIREDWKKLTAQQRLELLDDQDFRMQAQTECFKELERDLKHYRRLSLADRVVRSMLSKTNLKIDSFITFNHKDFIDVCKKYRRELLGSVNT